MSTRPEYIRYNGLSAMRSSFETQCRVIGALIMRELHTRYGRDNVGYLWMILEPGMLASAVALMHGATSSHLETSVSPVAFAIVGYGVFIIFRGIFGRAEGAIEANRPLLYHRMVTIFDMLAARALLEAAGVGMTIGLLLFVATLFGWSPPPARPLWLLLGMFYMVWFAWGASMVCCAGTHDNRLAGRLVHPATYLFMPISGGFFMMKWVPHPYRDWLGYVPTTNIFEMARYGQFQVVTLQYVDVEYITGWCLCLSVLGILSLKLVRKHVHLN